MHLVNLLTAFCISAMTGNELAVSLFVNPAIRRLGDRAIAGELARSLGKFMPFWYAGSLVLLVICAYLHRGTAGLRYLIWATVLWALTIACTLAFLVPINNRLACGQLRDADTLAELKRWDALHRWRIAALFVACVLALLGMQA